MSSKLLLVDDEPEFAEVLAELLAPLFGEITTVVSAAEALSLLSRKHDFSLVITDMNMPTLTGYDLLRFIRQKKDCVPVCFLTGGISDEVKFSAIALGVSEIFEKPFDFQDMVSRLKNIINYQELDAVKKAA